MDIYSLGFCILQLVLLIFYKLTTDLQRVSQLIICIKVYIPLFSKLLSRCDHRFPTRISKLRGIFHCYNLISVFTAVSLGGETDTLTPIITPLSGVAVRSVSMAGGRREGLLCFLSVLANTASCIRTEISFF